MPGVDVEAEDMKCEATALFYAAMAANEKAVGRGGGQKNKKQKKKTKRQSEVGIATWKSSGLFLKD